MMCLQIISRMQKAKIVLVDASLLLNNDWHSIATDVWQTPKEIFDKLVSNNLTLTALLHYIKSMETISIFFFDCSTRDGDLAKVQNYFDDGIWMWMKSRRMSSNRY